jgi:hypothetical protein
VRGERVESKKTESRSQTALLIPQAGLRCAQQKRGPEVHAKKPTAKKKAISEEEVAFCLKRCWFFKREKEKSTAKSMISVMNSFRSLKSSYLKLCNPVAERLLIV